MEYKLDEYTFTLSEGSTVIYIFKGEKYISDQFYKSEKDAIKAFEELKIGKRILVKGEDTYEIKKNKEFKESHGKTVKYETNKNHSHPQKSEHKKGDIKNE